MPTKMGRPTRKEKSKVNKAAHAAAMRDVLADSSRIPLDPYRKEEHLPSELIDGNALRRRRGTRTDEDCVNHVCELVACGMTCKAARDHVGVPAITRMTSAICSSVNLILVVGFIGHISGSRLVAGFPASWSLCPSCRIC
jgi:hypothetical protein